MIQQASAPAIDPQRVRLLDARLRGHDTEMDQYVSVK
jgi:hypothetical protein